MISKEVIFIFTRNRPTVLSKTLSSLDSVLVPKFVIDDSTGVSDRRSVSQLCKANNDCFYLGANEFTQFVQKYVVDLSKFSFLLREPGHSHWNLGHVRNFALLYAKSLQIETVLFMDDDIAVSDVSLIKTLFKSIDQYLFVGANIAGLPDDSILGHIATDLNIFNERMLSGGFLVFKPSMIEHYFLNNYNEDWIWLFLQLKNRDYLQIGEVYQQISDPLENFEEKVLFQEFGEIALDGILDLVKSGSYNELTVLSFWERMIEERRGYIDLLIFQSINKRREKYRAVLEFVKSNSEEFAPLTFQKLFTIYESNRSNFVKLYDSIC